jgi:hypothetical protein
VFRHDCLTPLLVGGVADRWLVVKSLCRCALYTNSVTGLLLFWCTCLPLDVVLRAYALWFLHADIYEMSAETLFLGGQDAMQRQTLVSLHYHMCCKPLGGAGMKCLEVACGTGRFATFIKVAYSADGTQLSCQINVV